MLQVSLVPSEEVPKIWDKVSHMLKQATDLSYGRYGLNDLKKKLLEGEFHLWIIFDDDYSIVAAVTTTFTYYPSMKTVHGQFLGGDRLPEWRDLMCDILDRWAIDNSCQMVELSGRAGWAKVLEPNGYKEVFRTYQRELK